ncbi:hypothetical protein SBOR_9944 [Sclerotinia borealis F-4128]|uniref:Uncharacterized protein n=1 Tax=Sclerotinia borealis (strain F-4128) TaxID=1432307 RepID=W9C194_SCLBF|nr:hypothetical protein SBOR_9944 [Sclerotinia borealis F-4128]
MAQSYRAGTTQQDTPGLPIMQIVVPFATKHQNCPITPKIVNSKVTTFTKPQLKAIQKSALAMETAILANQKPKNNPKEGLAPNIPIPIPTPISISKYQGGQIIAYENIGDSLMKT